MYPEEAQPHLEAFTMVIRKKGKAEAVLQPLFHSRQRVCNEEGLLVDGAAIPSVLGLHLLS